jgi:hypothetical protein
MDNASTYEPSSPPSSVDSDVIDYNHPTIRRELISDLCAIDPVTANKVLERYSLKTIPKGWCHETILRESKEAGYVQVSWAGANKFACLQTLVIWANAGEVRAGEDASHLCHHPRCLVKEHIISEPTITNQSRKGCRVWVDCYHDCEKKIFICPHQPACIKYCEGYRDHEEFMTEGLCLNVNDQPLARVVRAGPVPERTGEKRRRRRRGRRKQLSTA